jgi:hypothetical protein
MITKVCTGERSFKYINGFRQEVFPFLNVIEEANSLYYAIGILIVGHDKPIFWKANAKNYSLIVFLREVRLLEEMESIEGSYLESYWHFCRTTPNLHASSREKIQILIGRHGSEIFNKMKVIRKELLANGPSPAEYEEIIKAVRGSNLSEGAKDWLIALCREGKEFHNKIAE